LIADVINDSNLNNSQKNPLKKKLVERGRELGMEYSKEQKKFVLREVVVTEPESDLPDIPNLFGETAEIVKPEIMRA